MTNETILHRNAFGFPPAAPEPRRRRRNSDFSLLIPKAALTLVMWILAITPLVGQEPKVTLHDFIWTVNTIRSEPAIQREKAGCHLLTGGAVEEYKPTNKTLSIAIVTLKPEKAGELILIPELFLALDGDFYSLCDGVRVLAPKPSPPSGAFLPPSGGLHWPGQGARIHVTQGQPLVLELAFPFRLREGMQILAATPAVTATVTAHN